MTELHSCRSTDSESPLRFPGRGLGRTLLTVGMTIVALLWFVCEAKPGDQQPKTDAGDGFVTLFDGKSLAGWETPDPSYWSISEGAITGAITPQHPCTVNQYLVWAGNADALGGELADFELKLKSRLNGRGGINNGFQFRSRLLPDHDMAGYQVDNNLQTDWLVRLYDEFGRHTLAYRGERTTFDEQGKRTTSKLEKDQSPASFKLEEWHEYHLICIGNKLTLKVNGELVAEVIDRDPRRQDLQGRLGLQLHSGPETVVQFKDLRLKVLKRAEIPAPPLLTRREREREKLLSGAFVRWDLGAGGHGSKYPLQHAADFYGVEFDVRAIGTGARPGARVCRFQGAASPHLRNSPPTWKNGPATSATCNSPTRPKERCFRKAPLTSHRSRSPRNRVPGSRKGPTNGSPGWSFRSRSCSRPPRSRG